MPLVPLDGLKYIKNFIDPKEEQTLINFIDSQEWNTSLSRRTQHYGHLYVYKGIEKAISQNFLPIPQIFLDLFAKINQNNIGLDPTIEINKLQIIVNEYTIGQGIGKHIDDPKQFGKWVIGISLGSNILMSFGDTEIKIERLSLYEMTNHARYDIPHSITPRKSDKGVKRDRRISITMRYLQ